MERPRVNADMTESQPLLLRRMPLSSRGIPPPRYRDLEASEHGYGREWVLGVLLTAVLIRRQGGPGGGASALYQDCTVTGSSSAG